MENQIQSNIMISNTSIKINSMQFRDLNREDSNFPSTMKVSQYLDSRLKSVMPELKGKSFQAYLTIKIHKSLQSSKQSIIHQIKQHLQVPTSYNRQQMELNNFIKWSAFQQTKQLLKDEYLDNELYYIIVPEAHLSWAESFAKQQREGSDNRKKIHVLGVMKDSAYKERIKARSKKRIDKLPNYVHYYSIDSPQISTEIYKLICQHLQLKIKHQDNHIKQWALSNKYAHKKVTKRTVHIYFDNANKATLQNMQKHYNPRAQASWLQFHPYSSFYDIVKSIKQRESMNIKEADKVNQMTQQLTSKLIKSKSQIDFPSMKCINNLNSSQILSTSIQAGAQLNQGDVNVIISRTDFEEIDKLVAFIKAQKIKNWELVQINTDSPHFYKKMIEIFEIGKNFEKEYEKQRQQKIIQSKTLHVIAQANDQHTKELFYRQDNIFHNMELLQYNDLTDFAIFLRQGVKSKGTYTIAIIPGETNIVDYQFQRQIKDFMNQYKNTEVIDNFTFLSKENRTHTSILQLMQQRESNSSRIYTLASNDQGWLENILTERDNFFHPFRGLKGANVYLLIKATKEHLLNNLRQYIGQSQRLHISTYIDKQYLAKQLQGIQIKDSAIVITDDQTLREAQEVLVKFDEVFIMNITNRKNLKEEVKVFAWGDKQKVYDLLKMIPEVDHKLESQIYDENPSRLSFVRSNRFLPKKISFFPGNAIAIRLPADLIDEQSRKMEVRLKKYFNEQIKIEYYKDPRDIRLRNRSIQPLTFIILTEKQLNYMKTMAKKEIEQKRQEFILYDEDPEDFRYLIEKPEFERFRFLSNDWPDIQDYIIQTHGIYVQKQTIESIYEDEFIHVFVDQLPCGISAWIEKYVDSTQLKAVNNTKFHLKSDLEDVILMYPSNHKYFYVIEQGTNENEAMNKRRMGEEAFQKCKSLDQNKKLEFIILSSKKNSIRNMRANVKCTETNEKAVADWINSIKILKVDYLNSRPYILIDKNVMDWYDFLNKYSSLTGSFRFNTVVGKDDMRKTIENIRMKEPAEQIWILVNSIKQANECGKVAQKVESGRNISIIYHGSQVQKDQRNKIIFAHQDHKQVQKFIVNFFRRNYNEYFPSAISNSKAMLAPVNLSYKQFKTIPLNQREINNWKKSLNADIIYCSDAYELVRLAEENPNTTVYAILDANIEEQRRVQLERVPNIQRIILNMNSSYNPRALRNNFRFSNKQVYQGAYPAEIDNMLKYLRNNIKDSTPINAEPTPMIDPIHFKISMLDQNRQAQKNITKGQSLTPTQPLGFKQINKIQSCKTHLKTEIKTMLAPGFDIVPDIAKDKVSNQPDQSYPTLATQPKCPNNKLLGVKQNFAPKHKLISIMDDSQRWIDKFGYLLQVQNFILHQKQSLFLSIFTQKLFDSFNYFQYYYLSNKADVDRKFNIFFRTKEDLQEIYEMNLNLLMVVFVQSCDKRHIPSVLLQESHLQGGRVKIIYVHSQFVDDSIDLFVKFNEIDPVIYYINRIEFSRRRDYIVFREIDGDKQRKEVIMQRKIETMDSRPFKTMEDIDKIGKELKGMYKKIFVLCFPEEKQQIERIFQKYSIKNKKHSNQSVEFFYIDKLNTLNPNKNICNQPQRLTSKKNSIRFSSSCVPNEKDKNQKTLKSQSNAMISEDQLPSLIKIHQPDNNDSNDDKLITNKDHQLNETSTKDNKPQQQYNSKITALPSDITMESIDDYVHSNILFENIKLFEDNERQKIKRRLNGNRIVLIIEHSKKDKLKDIANKYNVLMQSYTNVLNLENGLRDHKDSATIAVINKNIIQKIIPLKKKYNQVIFILEDETPQQQLLQKHTPYIAGQIRKVSEIQKLLAELYSENQRIRDNEHNMRLAQRLENKRPQVLVTNYNSNELFQNTISNHKSKKTLLINSYERNDSHKFRLPLQQNYQAKKYTQKYQPNTFGTTPRFNDDFVPPKSMKETYSSRYMKSQSKSKVGRQDSLKFKNLYYQK